MTTNKVMMMVVAALMPSMIGSIYFYGHYAVKGYLLTVLFCVGFEYLFDKISGRETQIKDNSALLTGFLLAMNMPAGRSVVADARGVIRFYSGEQIRIRRTGAESFQPRFGWQGFPAYSMACGDDRMDSPSDGEERSCFLTLFPQLRLSAL